MYLRLKEQIMAIQVNLSTSNFGVPFTGAYFRIVTASLGRQRGSSANDPNFMVMLDVAGYATKPTDDNTREVDFRRYNVSYSLIEAQSGADYFTKCYQWVMAQPDMAGSTAV
jgi:hypothetical protein